MSSLDIASYNRQGQVFTAANTSAKSVIAVTSSMTGVILYNPVGSGKKLVLVHAGFVWTTVPAAVHNIGLALKQSDTVVPTGLTAIGSGVVPADGSATGSSVAKAYDAATLGATPIPVRWFGGALYNSASAVGVVVNPYQIQDYIEGAICVVPGAAACLTVVTTTAVGMGSISWIEVPV